MKVGFSSSQFVEYRALHSMHNKITSQQTKTARVSSPACRLRPHFRAMHKVRWDSQMFGSPTAHGFHDRDEFSPGIAQHVVHTRWGVSVRNALYDPVSLQFP